MKNKLLFIFGLFIPLIIVFHPLFSTTQIVAGDAPYFSKTELFELVSEPYVWTSRGENLGGVDPRLFISPILVLYGLLGSIGFTNEVIIRVLFYFPSIILSLVGPALLAKYFKQSKVVQFFASFLYVFNSYFLLLIDGGQVGISLAYGIFPFVILTLIKLLQKPRIKQFAATLLVTQALIISDPRFAGIALLFVAFGLMSKLLLRQVGVTKKHIKYIVGLAISLLGINAYWLYPLVAISGSSMSTQVLELQFLSLLNAFTLYQPHWPSNIFGHITHPAWYFMGIAFIVFVGLIVQTKNAWYYRGLILFLLFSFLLKGNNAPLGGMYTFATNHLPLGSAFRDSSKFFIPLLLVAGGLIGISIEQVQKLVKKQSMKMLLVVGMYGYLIAVLLPGIAQGFNFVLSGDTKDRDLKVVNETLESDKGFSRSAWFPERAPDTFETYENPAVDAKALSDYYPLANLTAGSSDKYNYVYQGDEFVEWYRLLGIKHLVFAGDKRNPFPDEETMMVWSRLLERMPEINGISRVNLDTNTQVYEVSDSLPQIYSIDELALVVGPMLDDENQYIPAVYFEDGVLDPTLLEGIDKDAGTIVFNNTDEDDLAMVFLQEYYIPLSSVESEWGIYERNQYLEWKYQMLIRGVATRDFNYGMGYSLSDSSGETITISLDNYGIGDYVLAIRSLGNENSVITYTLGSNENYISHKCISINSEDECEINYRWNTEGVSISDARELIVENDKGVNSISTVAIVPVEAWNEAQAKTRTFIKHFGVTEVDGVFDYDIKSYGDVDADSLNHTNLEITSIDETARWIVYNDSYHPDWKLKRGINEFGSVPLYSTVNAFYVDPEWQDVSIYFKGQEAVRWGLWGTAVSTLLTVIVLLWYWPSKRNDK